ncbi:MAG TPA: hypothetical protein DCG57_10355 [Candidatus Riflebacteria bacterium]|nr:hypothetical protein [Candidatus Riflebacteria bacterium]
MNQCNHSSTGGRQTAHLPVILWILPLLAINIGLWLFSEIDNYWLKHEQTVEARQEVEALAAASDFSYQYAKLAGEFVTAFKSGIEANLNDQLLTDYLQNRAAHVFRKPFPDYELFTFKLPGKGREGDLLHAKTDSLPSRRVLTRTFEHLIDVNKGGDISDATAKVSERMLASMLGQETRSEVTARSQKGKATFVLYKSLPAWFLWDYFAAENGVTYGFYLFSRFSDEHNNAGKLLALRDLRDHGRGYGAFMPLFAGYGGTVYQQPLNRSKIFREWVAKTAGSAEENLEKFLEKGIPEVTDLGNYLGFSYIGKSQSHLAVYLTRKIKTAEQPLWLFIFNLAGLSLISLMVLRGLLLNQWPEFNLRFRFIMTYLLAATLPISLLVISSYGYITQYRRATHFETLNSLQLSIKQFDTRKAQLEDEYRTAFNAIFKDEELIDILRKSGSTSDAARDRILHHFESGNQKLPLLCFAIIDENGNGTRYYGSQKKSEADPTIDTFSYPIVQMLRQKIKARDPKVIFDKLKASGIQETSTEAYQSLAGRSLVYEVDSRRSFAIKRQIGAKTATQMHDLVWIDGRENCAIFVAWDDSALDASTFKNSLNQIALNNPDQHFVAFKAAPQGLKFLIEPDRHITGDFINKARELANLAYFRGSYAAKQHENLSLVAIPAKKYDRLIIAGGTQHFNLNRAVEYRVWIMLLILLLSLAVVLLASYYSARLILDPIETLKSALVSVAGGRLTTEIESHSEDELGTLCREFSTMVVGLRERKRLATLLSDQAMDAITNTVGGERMLASTSFSGVAMVSDIRNFTGLCEDYPPDMITELLNEHFAGMASIISSHGGRIYKFIGDAVEAVFPENADLQQSAATRAFHAASMMLIKAKQINQTRTRKKLFSYRIGIGLAYGKMHSGSTGSLDTRLDYAIIGEPLKLAAKLEALSSQNQDFPLAIDEHLNQELAGHGIVFKEFASVEGKPAFSLYEVGGPQDSIAALNLKDTSSNAAQLENEVKKYVVGSGKTLSPKASFALGALLILAIVAGILFASHIHRDAATARAKGHADVLNQRTVEQVRSENAPLIGFETNCRQLVANLERKIDENHNFIKTGLTDFLNSAVGKSDGKSEKATRLAVFFVEPELTATKTTYRSKPIFLHGWPENHTAILSKQAALNRLLVDNVRPEDHIKRSEQKYFTEIFGDMMNGYILHYELLCKATEILTAEGKEFFYWDYIVTGSDPNRPGAFSRCEKSKIIGYFMASMPAEKLKNSASHLVESYETSEQKLALISQTGAITCSAGFPSELKEQLSYSDALPSYDKGVLGNDVIKIGAESYRLIVCTMLASRSSLLSVPLLIVILLISLATLVLWWKTSQGDSFINSSLAAKLWLALLLASIVPLITVYFVFNLFSDEDYSVKVSNEKSELHRFIDLFELRESFVDPMAWKMLQNWTMQEQTRKAADLLNRESRETGRVSSHTIDILRRVVDSWFVEHNKLNKDIISFQPRDLVIAGDGWSFVSSGNANDEPSKFGMMLQGVARNNSGKRISKTFKAGLDSKAVQNEMIVETGLQTVRSLFGDDVFVRMAHSTEIPVLMSAISGTIGMITHMAPNINHPEYLIIWMMSFNYESYLAKLASRQNSKYKIFAAITHRHGSLLNPYIADYRHELGLTGAWITSANLPVSKRLQRGGEWYLVEGRPGVSQLSSFLIATAPEAPIYAKIAQNRLIFWVSLFLAIILILLVAKNAAADILNPVESLITGIKFASAENYTYRINMKRGDELGELCASFDSMMRGLEEKNLMGRMLSKSALSYTAQNNTESSIGEFVFLYIGIPSFMSWVAGVSVEQMFSDLKEQIAMISGFVMSEGGDIDKIIGDKMLVVFAVEGNLPAAVASACQAASKIIAAESKASLPFPVAIGINSGKVITGLLGVGEKRDFTVIGDAVNVAARIESLAEVMRYQRCLLSENVYASLQAGVSAREYGEVELKGKAMPMKVYQLSL